MRTIKFRGKRIDNGEWVHGYLIEDRYIVGPVVEWTEDYFNTEFWLKVDPETLGQYTGLKDRNGKEVYEGDILRAPSGDEYFITWFQPNCEFLGVYTYVFGLPDEYDMEAFDGSWCDSQVIGNIYEHPHLLKGDVNA